MITTKPTTVMTKSNTIQRHKMLCEMIKNDPELTNVTIDRSGEAPTRVFEVIEEGRERLGAIEYRYRTHEPREITIGGNGRRRYTRALLGYSDYVYDERSDACLQEEIEVMETFLYGRQKEITDADADKLYDDNPAYVRLTCRIEAGMHDLQNIMAVMKKVNDQGDLVIELDSYQAGHDPMESTTAVFYIDESQMTLMEFKEFFYAQDVADCHIFIQTLDYAQYQGLRDRRTPSPKIN